ncbi:MAG TPA: 2-oxoglutarate dehydrogenase E1 component [Longimicrobiaceae bacterium]|nr:2-oxoglutarate dehydrogenase E1 component [Longimicrobiaceae bacterium]
MSDLKDFYGPNAGYVLDLHERFLRDPESVSEAWRSFFQGFTPSTAEGTSPRGGVDGDIDLSGVLGAHDLAETIRARGHTAARLSPISEPARIDPALSPEAHGISEADLAALPPQIVSTPAAAGAGSAGDAIRRLREIYSGTIGYEFDHIGNATEREWLRDAVESGRFRSDLGRDARHNLLKRLSQVEGFEKYLHKAFFGQKRFSIEGNDMMVPMLDELVSGAAVAGASDVVIGMAHRGRLNVLTHILDKPYALMLGGFAGIAAPKPEADGPELTGDVKYHMGWRHSREIAGHEVRITLSPNPSHLEFVNPVVVGMARAAQDDTSEAGTPTLEPGAALAIVIHGDAAFPGQGVVAETLNMSRTAGFTIGGTIHIIANNQIGFTTLPEDDRSTRYSSDLAKGFEIPIVHVNADDPEACLAVTRLAHAYRQEFHKDFLIDLIGYRRWGHNEGDEPAFTQPRMYDVVRSHPTVREIWSKTLIDAGTIGEDESNAILQEVLDRLSEVQDSLGSGDGESEAPPAPATPADREIETAVPADRLRELNEALLDRPDGFSPNARLAKLLDRRREALGEDGGIDWGHAESLAFASLLEDGRPVRLTGQDAERGTFSHRHLVLHGAETGEELDVLASLPQATASFEIHNSPLSETSVVGFEYGYTVFDPDVLVVWEAQFGDFANGAQVIIDQFISASYQKWGQSSGLVLLLPHGYEGQGPEHSSARLERFLQLAAEGNLRVVNCTTSAQYFHLLRRQAALLDDDPRPLIVMSPKSLLRHPMASSKLEQLATGSFQPVLADDTVAGREDQITRLLLCSGKVYVDLAASDARENSGNVALGRVEELYPFPAEQISDITDSLPALEEIVWVQEEPANMGAWTFVEPLLREVTGGRIPVRYAGRPRRASPAEGYADKHATEQARIVATAWEGANAPKRAKKRA